MDIKKERKNQGMTQQEFADLLGVTRKTIVNYESGGNIPESREKLFKYILKTFNKKENSSSQKEDHYAKDLNKTDKALMSKVLEKFEHIGDDEVALYVDFKKHKLLKNPLIKSIIKSEAWRIVEHEMRNLAIEKTLGTEDDDV
nr:helix-turn-helix transcriptional regulator [Aquimarina algiphila]